MRQTDAALKAKRDELVALAVALALSENREVHTASYVGSVGSDPMLTFPKPPLLVTVSGEAQGICAGHGQMYAFFADGVFPCATTWSEDGRTVTWHAGDAARRLNSPGTTYQVVAITAADA